MTRLILPALLAVLGPRIHAGAMPRRAGALAGDGEGVWHRTAEWVMRRPVLVLVPTLAILMALGAPFAQVEELSLRASDLIGPPASDRPTALRDASQPAPAG